MAMLCLYDGNHSRYKKQYFFMLILHFNNKLPKIKNFHFLYINASVSAKGFCKDAMSY